MTIQAQADIFTEVQQTLRQARDEKSEAKLRKGNELMFSDAFVALPRDAKADCRALYRDAFVAISGGLVG